MGSSCFRGQQKLCGDINFSDGLLGSFNGDLPLNERMAYEIVRGLKETGHVLVNSSRPPVRGRFLVDRSKNPDQSRGCSYFFRLRTYPITSSTAEPETVLTGFILPLPSVMIFFISSSLKDWTSVEFRSFMSTFIIFATAVFGVPSAPWQDLQDLSKIACPAFALAAKAAVAHRTTRVHVARIVCMFNSSYLYFNCFVPPSLPL